MTVGIRNRYSVLAFSVVAAFIILVTTLNTVCGVANPLTGALFSTIDLLLLIKVANTTRRMNMPSLFFVLLLALLIVLPIQAKLHFVPLSGNDFEGYERHAEELLVGGKTLIDVLVSSKNIYVRLIAALYCILGRQAILPYNLSFWSLLITLDYLARTMDRLGFNVESSRRVLLFFTFTPIEMVFGVSYLREMPIQALSAMVLYHSVCYEENSNFYDICLAFLYAVLASLMHSAMIALFILLLIALVFDGDTRYGAFRNMCVLVLFGLILSGNSILDAMTEKFGNRDLSTVLETASYSAGNTTYIQGQVNSILDLVIQMPYRMVMFTLAPFPWQFYNLSIVISFVLASVPQYYLVYRIVSGLKDGQSRESKAARLMALSLFAMYVICSIGTNNFGTAIRHRVKMYPVACCLLGYSYVDADRNDDLYEQE